MRLEHFALHVPDPVSMAAWYVKNLGCTVARSFGAPGFGHFITAGPVLIELYKNPNVPVPDYHSMHPSNLHLAFMSDDLKADRERLLAAGAHLFEDFFTNAAGDELMMLRDPWGIGLQLVKRAQPMLAQH